jgi:chromosome segregation ATPase
MSLANLESQIDDLRAQAERIQNQWARTNGSTMADETLTDIGKRTKLDTERERVQARLSDLRKKETEMIAAKQQSLEKSLFGLSSVASSDPGRIIAYRDAQDRAARLTDGNTAQEVCAAAMRSDDKTLAAAVLARALANGWSSIVADYVKQHPAAGDDLADLAKIQQYTSFEAGLSYITT